MIQHTLHRFNPSCVEVMYELTTLSPNSSPPPLPAAQMQQNALRLAFLNSEQANKLLLIDSNVETALVSSWPQLNNARNKRTTKDSNRDDFIIFTYNNYCLIHFSFANDVFNVKFAVFTNFYLACTNERLFII